MATISKFYELGKELYHNLPYFPDLVLSFFVNKNILQKYSIIPILSTDKTRTKSELNFGGFSLLVFPNPMK